MKRFENFRWETFTSLLVLVFLLGSWGVIFTDAAGAEWYYSLPGLPVKPPLLVFWVVWPVLFVLMALSATIVWESKKSLWRKAFIYTFGANLVFNSFWSAIFFGFRNQCMALADLFLVWVTVIALMWLGLRVSRKAVWLLSPYFLWVTLVGAFSISAFLG